MKELSALQPGARFHLTATTRAGRARLAGAGCSVSLAPIDAPQVVRRFFDGIRPARLILVETEIWPHWLLRARAEGVPVVVLSARLSTRSLARYRRLGPRLRELVSSMAAVLCQSDEDARRWIALGAPESRTAVMGNLKSDAIPAPAADRIAARLALGLDPAAPVIVLGSLRPGEGRHWARAWSELEPARRDAWQVVAVPRHPRATAELKEEVEANRNHGGASGRAWRWDDRSGVLNAYYAVADVAFVGGSLARHGGHNPIEPAACRAAVLMGPHHESQAEAVRDLEQAGGITLVGDPTRLAATLEPLLADPALRVERARAAFEVAESRRGVARRAVRRLAQWNLWPAA
jgi:3-deoxy-D-manno-octulosonic-acid transferase